MELIGIPHRVIIGEKNIDAGMVEYKCGRTTEAELCRWIRSSRGSSNPMASRTTDRGARQRSIASHVSRENPSHGKH